MKTPQYLRTCSLVRTALTACARRIRICAVAERRPKAMHLAHVGSVVLAFVLAAAILTLASLQAIEAHPEIVAAPESEPVDPANSSLVSRDRAPLSPLGDILSRCFDGELAEMGGTADGRGYQRADPACQRH